jgi:hypothetical protein
MNRQIDRITRMEQLLNESVAAVEALDQALAGYQGVREKIAQLQQYYEGGEWMEDFRADCEGRLPAGLPRGVLTEDAVYDLLTDCTRLRQQLRALLNDEKMETAQ